MQCVLCRYKLCGWRFNIPKAANSATFGYSLAQPEIDRLKELIEEAYLSGWRRYAIGGDKKDGFKQFKQQHNL